MARPVDAIIVAAREFMGERMTVNAALREQHAKGQDHLPPTLPDAVAFIESTEEASRLLALCNAAGVAVTAWGAGTSSEGHVVPLQGGISLNLSRMTEVLAVNAADLDARVQAGVTRQQLNRHLHDQGLFFPVDPGGEATIGGMCATRASGTNAVRYGTIRENVLGLTVVMADGRIVQTGGRVRKSSTGYDLTHLFIGSEGTLGVITEIQLRLHGIAESQSAAICQFDRLDDAVASVIEIIQTGIPVARIELLDAVQMGACIAYSHLDEFAPVPTLLFEFDGSPNGVAEQAENALEIARSYGAQRVEWAAGNEGRTRLWKARHDAYWAAKALAPTYTGVPVDVIVPISRLGEMIAAAQGAIADSGLVAPIIGHVGDGNFHCLILLPPGEPLSRASDLDHAIARRALQLGGSCSGEHGIGMTKRELMVEEHGAEAVALMRQLKQTMDPRGILNPGKIFLDQPAA